MLTNFEVKEINRAFVQFREFTNEAETMSLETFLTITPLEFNPLKHRIAIQFGFTNGKIEINFKEFICGLALFNSNGNRESKIKVAFQIQDFDDDGVLSRDDLLTYVNLVTNNGLANDFDIETVVEQLLDESFAGQEVKGDSISFNNFQRIMMTMDFQSKMRIPI